MLDQSSWYNSGSIAMKYAVIQIAGKQYRVSEGDKVETNRLAETVGESITVSDVLLVVDGDKALIGDPLVKGASVTLQINDHHKGDKIRVAKYKSKSRYRKVIGHRQALTTWEVVKIAV